MDDVLQAADDARLQLGRTGRNISDLIFMFPSIIIICLVLYGMLEAWWGGIVVIFALNSLVALVGTCWAMADHLEAVKNAAVLSRSVKFILKFMLTAGGIVLFAFMVDPATVRLGTVAPFSCRQP